MMNADSKLSFLINQIRNFSRKMFIMLSINCLYLPKLGHGPDAALVSLTDDLFLVTGKVKVPHSHYCVQYC